MCDKSILTVYDTILDSTHLCTVQKFEYILIVIIKLIVYLLYIFDKFWNVFTHAQV